MARSRRPWKRPKRPASGSGCSWAGPGPACRRRRKGRNMQLVLEKRPERSAAIAVASPLLAIALTLITIAVLFAIIGKDPLAALYVYFIKPLTDSYSLQEIAVKASPLVMIAVGLALCYTANIWNIGAEGQFVVGAVT